MNSIRNKLFTSVQILIYNKYGEILLLKRKGTGFSDGKYGFVGGHVEKGENIKEAIIRETKEEIGIQIEEKYLELRSLLNRKVDSEIEYIDIIFSIKNWKGTIKNMEPEKCSEFIWCDINSLPEDIINFEEYILKNEKKCLLYGW